MTWVFDSFFLLLTLALLLIFLLALVSPFEALGWWAGWSRKELQANKDILAQLAPDNVKDASNAEYYLVYLTGINGYSGDFLGHREMNFLTEVKKRAPGVVIVSDVFAFSASNNPLNGDRILAKVWEWIHALRLKNPHIFLKNIISIRNIMQVAVSADPRYGPINNVGVAKEIAKSLLRKGYVPGSGKAIFLVGVSGGGQVALGSARYLRNLLQAPVYLISMAGVLSDDPAISSLEHLYHINGSKDNIPKLGAILYPGRWPILPHSAWNQAKKAGKITYINPGPMTHMGRETYFTRSAKLPNGQSYLDRVVDIVTGIFTNSLESVTPKVEMTTAGSK